MEKYKLSELIVIKNGRDHKDLPNGDYPVFGSGGIMRYVNSYLYDKPSVLLPRKGSLSNIQYSDTPFWTVDTLYYTEINEELVSPYYLYRYLRLLDMSRLDSGTGVPSMTFDSYYNINVFLPNIEEQRRVASILQKIDAKIALNHQINDNLEAMAKQLYDYWFVQFDFPNEEGKPYKSSGGAVVWNERLKCEIPQGWSGVSLKDLALTSRNAITPVENEVYQHFSIPSFDACGSYSLDNGSDIKSDKFVLQEGQLLVSKLNPWFNRVVWVPKGTNMIGSTEFVVLNPNNESESGYIYSVIKSPKFIAYCSQAATGTSHSQRRVSPDVLMAFKVGYEQGVVQKYGCLIEKIQKQQAELLSEIAILTKQRDELLPLLMNGQATVNYHLSASFHSSFILYRDQYKFYDMKETIIQAVLDGMRAVLTDNQLDLLTDVTRKALSECEITPKATEEEQRNKENAELLGAFISSKKVEGCSDKTIHYYKSSIEKLIATVKKNVCDIVTNDIRCYLAEQQEQRELSKVTIDNLRRIFSSFFSWLEDEDYITKSPVRRIHKVRTDALVKEVLTDENIEVLRDSCQEMRDVAMIDLLLSTGMRVGELVKINREDIDFQERQCVVFGKGNKEREVYFNARTKIHLKKYLEQRTDTNPALFVSLHEPHTRLTISGVEVRLRQLGKRVNMHKVHPHKFRRTLATMAIDKGMPIEQVQKMLGHVKIDTTLHYAMVNQANVKAAHRKFLN